MSGLDGLICDIKKMANNHTRFTGSILEFIVGALIIKGIEDSSMFTNEELRKKEHILPEAYELQEKIQETKKDLEAMEVKYNQIIEYCKENEIEEKDGYTLRTVKRTERKIDPKKFAKEFPDANEHLVVREIAYMKSELKNLEVSRILKEINIKDTKDLVIGFGGVNVACKLHVTERTVVMKIKEDPV